MDKQQAMLRLAAIEKESSELKKIIETPDKRTAKEWMLNFLSQEFTVKLTQGYIAWYLNGQWVFEQDFKKKRLLCYYYKVWQVFEDEYSLNYQQIQATLTETVGEALNCRDFITRGSINMKLR